MKVIVLTAVFTIFYVLCMDVINKCLDNINMDIQTSEKIEEGSNSSVYLVSILGNVVAPGEYSVPAGSTLGHLITLAGGLTKDADITTFNSSILIESGKSYYIGSLSLDENNKSTKISINTATQVMLDSLPGVGAVLAARIIDYRAKNGFFTSLEELKKVQGIGENIFEELKELICL